jgi:ATP-binding cassette subfamily C protein CydC
MRPLVRILRLLWQDQRPAFLRGAALSVVVLAMGAALLGLSGWFITAAAAAGLAGAGATFDVFRPSAMVRFLALGRAAARYGERVLTHDATLRALESLRGRVLAVHLAAPWPRMVALRGAQALNRLTADIDALDGVPLRLALPLGAGAATLALALAVLWALVGPALALWIVGGHAVGATAILVLFARRAVPLSRRAERAAQAFRARLIDLIRARADLAVYGRLTAQAAAVQGAEDRRRDLRRALDRVERRAGAALAALTVAIAAGTLGLGMAAAQAGTLDPARAALALFVALALAEVVAPLRRAAADLGRMTDAARRVGRDLAQEDPPPGATAARPGAGTLVLTGVTLTRPDSGQPVVRDLSLTLHPGEVVALTGPSGAGKSTVLLAMAGLHPLTGGSIELGGSDLSTLPEPALRGAVTLLPQRSALMAGTVADALRLSGPADDATLWQALAAVQLDGVIAAKGGLAARIGPRGAGLSGGEARRLALARAILRAPRVLLLDEPTEGLDDATARATLAGIRAALPQTAILMAAHRGVETAFADRTLSLSGAPTRPEVASAAPVS